MKAIGTKIVSGVIWTSAETWGREGTLLIVFIVLARLLGPEAIGLVALAMTAPLIFAIPVAQGIPDAIVQRPEIEDVHLHSAFWLLLVIGASLTALIWAGSDFIASLLGEPALRDLLRWTSLIVAITAFGAVPGALLRRQLEFRLFALRTMIGVFFGGIVGIALALQGFGVWSLVAMNVGRAALESGFIFWASGWRPRLRFSFARCRDLFGFAGPIVAQSFVRIFNDEIPKIVIGTFLSPGAVGVYALARKPVGLLTNVLVGPIRRVTMPAVSRMHGDKARIDRFFDISVRLTAIIGFPAFVGFAALAPTIVPAVLGEEWRPAIIAVQILMLLGLMRSIDGICVHVILAAGHSRLLLALHLAYTVLAVVLFPLAAHIGLVAVLLAIVACNYALLPVFLYKVRALAQVDVMKPIRALPLVALATVLMFFAVQATERWALDRLPPLTVLILCVSVGATVYGGIAGFLLREDLLKARNLLHRLRAPAAEVEK